jgi:hypothetical protein
VDSRLRLRLTLFPPASLRVSLSSDVELDRGPIVLFAIKKCRVAVPQLCYLQTVDVEIVKQKWHHRRIRSTTWSELK